MSRGRNGPIRSQQCDVTRSIFRYDVMTSSEEEEEEVAHAQEWGQRSIKTPRVTIYTFFYFSTS